VAETALDRLRRLLPEAKRILSHQTIEAPWHALLAAEDLVREIDEARARFLAEVDRVCGLAAPAGAEEVPTPEPAEESGP
jgi:hypothetical protein